VATNVSAGIHDPANCICHGYLIGDIHCINRKHNLTKDIYCTNCHSDSNETGDIPIQVSPYISGRNQTAHYLIKDDKTAIYEHATGYLGSSCGLNMTGNVLLMHMDETSGTIVDYSGEKNDGTGHNIIYGVPGISGTALGFNGQDAYVSASNDQSLKITGPLTLEAWVNFSSLGETSNFNGIVAKWCHSDQGGTGWGYGLFKLQNTNRIAFVTASSVGGGYADAYSNSVPTLQEWYHVVGTYDGTTMLLYINGELQTKTETQSGIYDNDEPITIGSFEVNKTDFWFNGTIDEVAIYNRALSADEVLERYQMYR
jgi:hypothetical protein